MKVLVIGKGKESKGRTSVENRNERKNNRRVKTRNGMEKERRM